MATQTCPKVLELHLLFRNSVQCHLQTSPSLGSFQPLSHLSKAVPPVLPGCFSAPCSLPDSSLLFNSVACQHFESPSSISYLCVHSFLGLGSSPPFPGQSCSLQEDSSIPGKLLSLGKSSLSQTADFLCSRRKITPRQLCCSSTARDSPGSPLTPEDPAAPIKPECPQCHRDVDSRFGMRRTLRTGIPLRVVCAR